MADGDVRLDDEYEFPDGTRVVLYAVENSEYPGGVSYRFAYFDPETGRNLLRYDNSRTLHHDVGVHHRHHRAAVSRVSFDGLRAHVSRFWREVSGLRDD